MKSAATAAVVGAAAVLLVPVVVLTAFLASEPTASGACGAVATDASVIAGGAGEQPGSDGTPTIMGTAVLAGAQIRAWYESHGSYSRTVGPGRVPIEEVIAAYYLAGKAEGVRPDLAFIQAVHETGGFTNTDARTINNFAGVAHYDNLSVSGTGWATAQGGVIGHIQLLKRYAQGNNAALALPEQTVTAGATALTFGALAGTWATDRNYWSALARLYNDAGGNIPTGALCPPAGPVQPVTGASGPVTLGYVQGVPVNATVQRQVEAMITAATADGVALRLGNSYRSIDSQIALRRSNCGSSQYAIYQMPSGQCSPPTARPGASQHQLGLAIDFASCSSRGSPCYRWLTTNAARYGYYNLPSEPWHWSTTGR